MHSVSALWLMQQRLRQLQLKLNTELGLARIPSTELLLRLVSAYNHVELTPFFTSYKLHLYLHLLTHVL